MQPFKAYWTLYYILLTVIIGTIIAQIDSLEWINGAFTAAAAGCNAGLGAVSMTQLSRGSIILTAILMVVGCPIFMLFPILFFRRWHFQQVNMKMIEQYQQNTEGTLPYANLQIIKDYYLVYESTRFVIYILLLYWFMFIFFGIILVWATLLIRPLEPELVQRGYTYIENAIYLVISSFCNTGLSISSNSLVYMTDNPACYFVLSVLILAGNTAFPIFLRALTEFLLYADNRWDIFKSSTYNNHFSRRTPYSYSFSPRVILTFLLNHPREILTHLFTDHQTKILVFMVCAFLTLQFVCFLISIDRHLLDMFPLGRLIGIGYFQTLSTRSAGFMMMNLRDLNFGLTFIYFIMMYLNTYPFVTTMKASKPKLPGEEEEEKDEILDMFMSQPDLMQVEQQRKNKLEEDFPIHVKRCSSSIVLLEEMKNVQKGILQNTISRHSSHGSHRRRRRLGSNMSNSKGTFGEYSAGSLTISSGRNQSNKNTTNTTIGDYHYSPHSYHTLPAIVEERKRRKEGSGGGGGGPQDENEKNYYNNSGALEMVSLSSEPSMNTNRSNKTRPFVEEKDENNNNSSQLHYFDEQSDSIDVSRGKLLPPPEDVRTSEETKEESMKIMEQNSSKSNNTVIRVDKGSVLSETELTTFATNTSINTAPEKKPLSIQEPKINGKEDNNNNEKELQLSPFEKQNKISAEDIENGKVLIVSETKKQTDEEDYEGNVEEEADESTRNQIARMYLLRHSFFILLAILVLAYVEDGLLRSSAGTTNISLWFIIFEVVSAYSSVGLSFGVPGKPYSLSGELTSLGKFVIICMMWMGKHRGLPNRNDPVIDFTFDKFQKAFSERKTSDGEV
jgi:Trk-type K+ transport system membrane component